MAIMLWFSKHGASTHTIIFQAPTRTYGSAIVKKLKIVELIFILRERLYLRNVQEDVIRKDLLSMLNVNYSKAAKNLLNNLIP